jgi:hypothetical protein
VIGRGAALTQDLEALIEEMRSAFRVMATPGSAR